MTMQQMVLDMGLASAPTLDNFLADEHSAVSYTHLTLPTNREV